MESEPLVYSADFTFSVDVDFAAHVMITQESGRSSRDDIVVVDPSIMADLQEGRVFSVSDARCPEAKDGLRIRRNGGEFTAYGADSGHCTAEGVASEPDGALVFTQMVFDIGPEQIDVGMESAVDTADFGCDRPGFGIGRNVVPFSRFGTARNYKAIEACSEYIGFRTGFLDEFALVDPGGVDDLGNLFWWTVSQP